MSTKEYLADSVYAEIDNGSVCLTTENGIEVSNRIYLDIDVLRALDTWRERYNVPIFTKERGT